MSVEWFLDTNVIVYSFDESAPEKRERATNLIARSLRDGSGAVSWQVVQEFLNVALHKWAVPMTVEHAQLFLRTVLHPLCAIYPSEAIWRSALHVRSQSQYGFYDSMIVAAAMQSGAKILWSEDLQTGRRFGDLELRDPFKTT